jgi:hypothetical protein
MTSGRTQPLDPESGHADFPRRPAGPCTVRRGLPDGCDGCDVRPLPIMARAEMKPARAPHYAFLTVMAGVAMVS